MCSVGRVRFEPIIGGVRGNLLRTKRSPVRGAAQLVPHNVLALVGASNATTYLFLACYPITRIYCPRGMTVPLFR